MKKCIFHIPYKLDPNAQAAPMLRPRMMIDAFKSLGYDVAVVSGTSKERVRLMADIKNKIKTGEKYDFMYAENSTMPSALSDPGHLPRHPFADHDFFKFVKKHGIAIGLFYRDVYWKFPVYKEQVQTLKRLVAVHFYKSDLKNYAKCVNKLYVPTMKCYGHIALPAFEGKAEVLPPGCKLPETNTGSFSAATKVASAGKICRPEASTGDCNAATNVDGLKEVCRPVTSERDIQKAALQVRNFAAQPLEIFYVGGLGGHYRVEKLVEAVARTEGTRLTICCREAEWNKERANIEPYMCDRVTVVHRKNDEIGELYEKADICSSLFERSEYMDMAMPYKTFEALSYGLPSLATEGTAAGDFIEAAGCGCVLDYDADEITACLRELIITDSLGRIKAAAQRAAAQNTWKARAEQVVDGLAGNNET